jgi:hypothetical protein
MSQYKFKGLRSNTTQKTCRFILILLTLYEKGIPVPESIDIVRLFFMKAFRELLFIHSIMSRSFLANAETEAYRASTK